MILFFQVQTRKSRLCFQEKSILFDFGKEIIPPYYQPSCVVGYTESQLTLHAGKFCILFCHPLIFWRGIVTCKEDHQMYVYY